MQASNDAQVPTTISVSAIGQFESNEDFQKHNASHEADSAFLHFQRRRKAWIQPKGDTRANREVMTTLLASQGENCNDCIEKLLAVEISYRDLASLTHKDLELMDFKHHKQRQDMLNLFAMLPNQDPSYDSICQLPEAKGYNHEIFKSTCSQMETMRSALAAANYKLKIMPPEDVIVGEKSFASRFVLEALAELRGVSYEISKELEELETLIAGRQNIKTTKRLVGQDKASRSFSTGRCILLSSVVTGALAALWIWKLNKLVYV